MRAFGTLRIPAKPSNAHEQNIDIGMSIEDIEGACEIAGIVQVVVVEKGEYLAASNGDPGVLCSRPALRFVVPVDACLRMLRDNRRSINRRIGCIVYDNDLPVAERLHFETAQCFLEQRQSVVGG